MKTWAVREVAVFGSPDISAVSVWRKSRKNIEGAEAIVVSLISFIWAKTDIHESYVSITLI